MLERDEDTGRFLPEKLLKIRAVRFREHLEATRSVNTAQTYLMGARKLDDYLEEMDLTLETAPSGLLNNFVGWLSTRHLTPTSIRSNMAGASRYIKWCRGQEEGIGEFDVPELPKIPETEPFVLTNPELEVFVNEVNVLQEPARTALLMIPFSGLRVSELCKLRLSDIKPANDEKKNPWTVFEVDGKGKKLRFVPLLPGGKDILADYLEGWRARKKSKWLFP